MSNQVYKCCECGKITTKKNEFQCPECMTIDSLIPTNQYFIDEEAGIFDVYAEEYFQTEEW